MSKRLAELVVKKLTNEISQNEIIEMEQIRTALGIDDLNSLMDAEHPCITV